MGEREDRIEAVRRSFDKGVWHEGSSQALALPVLKRWLPWESSTSRIVEVPARDWEAEFREEEDIIFKMPERVHEHTLVIHGGNRKKIIGGAITRNGGAGATLQFQRSIGQVFLEGLLLDTNASNADLIDVFGVKEGEDPEGWTFPDLIIQNCRGVGVHGEFGTVHADTIQAQGPNGVWRIYESTFETNYQCIFAPSQSVNKSSLLALFVDRTNIRMMTPEDPARPYTYPFWIMTSDREEGYPVILGSEVYIDLDRRPESLIDPAEFAVFPKGSLVADGTGHLPRETRYGAINGERRVYWPESVGIIGDIKIGRPARDFCELTDVGLGYRSPGSEQRVPSRSVVSNTILRTAGTYAERPPAPRAGDGFRYFAIDVEGGMELVVKSVNNRLEYVWSVGTSTDDVETPSSQEMLAWSTSPGFCNGSAPSTVGVLQVTRFNNMRAQLIREILAVVTNEPRGARGCFLGIQNMEGRLIAASTRDEAEQWNVARGRSTLVIARLNEAIMLPRERLRALILCEAAETAPTFLRRQTQGEGQINAGISRAELYKAATFSSRLRELPAAINPRELRGESVGGQFFIAVR